MHEPVHLMAPALLAMLFAEAVQSNGVGVVVAPTVQLLDTGGAGGPTASVSAQVGEQRAERRATSVGWFRLSGDSLACRVEIMSRARPVGCRVSRVSPVQPPPYIRGENCKSGGGFCRVPVSTTYMPRERRR